MKTLAKRAAQTGNEQAVVDAAAEAVARLSDVRMLRESPGFLLRASEESTSEDELLRAAHGVSETPAEQLLRAGE